MKQTRSRWLLLLALQLIVILYSLSNVMSKIASNYPFASLPYIWAYGGEILLLGLYAVLWQQMIQRLDLTTAYASRATALFWSMLWARLFFGESITPANLIGVVLVIVGTLVVITDE